MSSTTLSKCQCNQKIKNKKSFNTYMVLFLNLTIKDNAASFNILNNVTLIQLSNHGYISK